MFLRLFLVRLRARRARPLGLWDVGHARFRVGLRDLDVLRHMNNGVYLSLMDLGRLDLMIRNGVWAELGRRGWYPVIAAQTITYRRSLELGRRFVLESRLLGVAGKEVLLEQRFTVGGEIHARAVVRARMLSRSGERISAAHLADAFDADTAPGIRDPWIAAWAEASVLPPSREPAPSVWE
jgi:acyl-CoA thioesterase FadM